MLAADVTVLAMQLLALPAAPSAKNTSYQSNHDTGTATADQNEHAVPPPAANAKLQTCPCHLCQLVAGIIAPDMAAWDTGTNPGGRDQTGHAGW